MAKAQYVPMHIQGQGYPPPIHTAKAWSATRPRMDIHDTMAYLSIMLVVLFADNLRGGGAAVYFACVLLAGLSLGRNIPRKTAHEALMLAGIVLFYCFLSYLHVLPRGWTVFYQKSAIVRQALPLIGFCVMLVAYHRFWGRLLAAKFDDRLLWWVLAVLFLVGPFVDVAFKGIPSLRVASTLRNASLVFLVITSYMAYSRRGKLLLTMPLVYLLLAALTSYSQTRGFYIVAALVLWAYAVRINFSRAMVLGIVSVVVLAATIVLLSFDMHDYVQLYYADFNTAWRLIFWRDVFHSTMMTYGLGVGFGTEALVNVYPGMPRPIFILNPAENPDFIMIGTHNAFTDALLRCGIPGFLMVVWIVMSSARILRRRYSPTVAISFSGAFLCVFVNVALQSPLYSAGIAFTLGFCRAMQAVKTPRAAPSPPVPPESAGPATQGV